MIRVDQSKLTDLSEVCCNPEDSEIVQEMLVNDGDYFGRKLSTNVSVPGNPHKVQFREFWTSEIKPSSFILDTIEYGYKLPFSQVPPKSFEKNNKSAREDQTFVRAEMLRLEKLGCISRVTEQPHLVLPLSSIFSKKKRVVVDASRALNPFLQHRRVRLQDLRDVPNVVKKDCFMCCDDLDSGYWHIKTHPDDRKYLGVHITDENGDPIFFVWNVLFLGVADAAFIFTAVLKPVRAYIASMGIPCLIYLDDFLTLGGSEEEAKKNRDRAVEILSKTGFVVSKEKFLGPSSRLKYLGLEVCSVSSSFYIPTKKVDKIINFVNDLCQARRVKLRHFASFLGFLQSCSRALGPVVRMRTRLCYHWLMDHVDRLSYETHVKLSEAVREELVFWKENIHCLNGHPFSPSLSIGAETRLMIITDSSASGCFGFQFVDKYQILLRRSFTREERNSSSTFRELLALRNIYTEAVADQFAGQKILHLTDNKAVESIMSTGSRKLEIQEVALAIFMACRRLRIELRVEWRPREHFLLEHADIGSKSIDENNVSLNFNSFSQLLEAFPEVRVDVDGFAQYCNRKAEIFFSKMPEPESTGVNFFSQRLFPYLSYYCFPPPGVILATILHLSSYQTSGLLVIPIWPSSSFWTNIVPDGRHLPGWAKRIFRFRAGFITDPDVLSSTFKDPATFDTLIIKFDFGGFLSSDLCSANVTPENCLLGGCHLCIFN